MPKKTLIKTEKPPWDGLAQVIYSPKQVPMQLKDLLVDTDWWDLKSGDKVMYILTHDAVKKIADYAGILTDVQYSVLIAPNTENNYLISMQARISDTEGKVTSEIGEASRNNLGTRGRNNPTNMAQKRAYDRAVLRHLGIVGFLGEDELPEQEDKKMHNLSPDEAKQIVDLLNEVFQAKNKKDLTEFSKKMLTVKDNYQPKQLEVLRNAWNNQMIKFNKSF